MSEFSSIIIHWHGDARQQWKAQHPSVGATPRALISPGRARLSRSALLLAASPCTRHTAVRSCDPAARRQYLLRVVLQNGFF